MIDTLTGANLGVINRDGNISDPNYLTFKEINEGTWISKELNNGDWPYWLIIRMIDMEDYFDETGINVEISAVSPQAAGNKNVKSALSSYGFKDSEQKNLDKEIIAECLCDYGVSATLASYKGNGKEFSSCFSEAKEKAEAINMLFGFYMDKIQNAMGNTGWDLIRGNIGFIK